MMDRRDFVKRSAAATLAATVSAAAEPAKAKTKRPNVLFLFSDQHRAQSLPGEPFNQAMAPVLDDFRRKNLSMDRCISNYPLCTPYRGILLSGRWPSQTGIVYNNVPMSPKEVTLGDTFGKAGYRTGYVGKWHLAGHGEQPGFIPKGPYRMGFDDWHAWDATNLHYKSWTFNPDTGEKIFPQGWQPIRMTDQAVAFLHAQSADKPWFLIVSWNPPHPPYNPPPKELEKYPPDTLKLRPNIQTRPGEPGAKEGLEYLASEAGIRKALQGYDGAITGIDTEVGRLLKTLDELGMTDDTIVVYTSDHGEMMGSHGRMQKQVPFEESCRVPFMVRYPGVTKTASQSDHLFAAVDIYPTLCGLAGVPVPPHCVGKDFSPLMRGEGMKEPEMVFLMNELQTDGMFESSAFAKGVSAEVTDGPHAEPGKLGPNGDAMFVNQPSYRGVRTKTHTYAVALSGRWLLFDNVNDPYQMKNLVNDAAQKPLMDKLDAAMVQWMHVSGDTFPLLEKVKHVSDFPS